MTGGNNVNTRFYHSVKVQMTLREQERITPFHRGVDIDIHAPVVDGLNLLKIKGYNTKKIDWVDLTFTGSMVNPYPLKQVDKDRLDDELARLDSKHKILQDGLKSTNDLKLSHEQQPRDQLQTHSIPVDHPYLDGENDHLRSKMTNLHEVETTLENVRKWEYYFQRRRAFYPRGEFNKNQYHVHTREMDGTKMATMTVGDI